MSYLSGQVEISSSQRVNTEINQSIETHKLFNSSLSGGEAALACCGYQVPVLGSLRVPAPRRLGIKHNAWTPARGSLQQSLGGLSWLVQSFRPNNSSIAARFLAIVFSWTFEWGEMHEVVRSCYSLQLSPLFLIPLFPDWRIFVSLIGPIQTQVC